MDLLAGAVVRLYQGRYDRVTTYPVDPVELAHQFLDAGLAKLHVVDLDGARHGVPAHWELVAELASSQGDALRRAEAGIPGLPANAGRWIGEMEEIAATFDAAGVTPHFHQGAAEIYRLLASTPFASESPEDTDASRTLADTIEVLAELLPTTLQAGD